MNIPESRSISSPSASVPRRGRSTRREPKVLESRVRGLLEDQLADLTTRFPALLVERHIAADNPLRSLLAEADTARAVVVGQRAHTAPNGVIGSTSRSVLEFGSCPVVVVPLRAAVL